MGAAVGGVHVASRAQDQLPARQLLGFVGGVLGGYIGGTPPTGLSQPPAGNIAARR